MLFVGVTSAVSLGVFFFIYSGQGNSGYSLSGQFELTVEHEEGTTWRVLWDPKSNRAAESYFSPVDDLTSFTVLRFDEKYVMSGKINTKDVPTFCHNTTTQTKGIVPDKYWSSTTCSPTTLCGGGMKCTGNWNSELGPSVVGFLTHPNTVISAVFNRIKELTCFHVCVPMNGVEQCKDLTVGSEMVIKHVQPTSAAFARVVECPPL